MSLGNLFRASEECDRDCRLTLDKPPYVDLPTVCPNCLRTFTACGCSCIDMTLPPPVDPPDDEVTIAMATAFLVPITCYCSNAHDLKSTAAQSVGVWNFRWDESALSATRWLLTKAAKTCPGNPHTFFLLYRSVPTTNLACVTSSADWVGLPWEEGELEDPEPAGSGTKSFAGIPKEDHPELTDCEATRAAFPAAFLIEVIDGCSQVMLLCSNLAPGAVVWTCPPCSPTCISISIDHAGTFSTYDAEAGQSDCTVKFTVVCPSPCVCLTGKVTVTFTLGPTILTVGPLDAAGGDTLIVMTPTPAEATGDPDETWTVDIAWHCESSDTPCPLPEDCVGLPACPSTAGGTIIVPVGGTP